ncbi:MAG: hypothetical protein JOY62_13810 [Acidobacteriaceae bacterium]|nr:hypothetical protein [Acidobacteriaceae bacterium]MBV9781038.1 hypothetical protein [Acidobacteriaceae bacterium]
MLRSSMLVSAGLLATLCLISSVPTLAQRDDRWGTSAAVTAARVPDTAVLPDVDPTFISNELEEASAPAATGFSYATGGGALRNRSTTAIGISGVVSPTVAAYLYWAVITEGTPPTSVTSVTLSRESPAPPATAVIKGTAIGSGISPCWLGNQITVYRGTVSTSLANGNGLYRVTISSAKGTAGSTDGADPWLEAKDPLWEGASLVVVGKGTGSVVIFDKGLAGATFKNSLSYKLNLPVTASGKLTLFDNIAADGQYGVSRIPKIADKLTEMNGKYVMGKDSPYNDAGWNGSSGLPLPQLWDDTGVDITPATPKGTKTISVSITQSNSSGFNDCLTPVANVLEIH